MLQDTHQVYCFLGKQAYYNSICSFMQNDLNCIYHKVIHYALLSRENVFLEVKQREIYKKSMWWVRTEYTDQASVSQEVFHFLPAIMYMITEERIR